jgi:hypothetical protein
VTFAQLLHSQAARAQEVKEAVLEAEPGASFRYAGVMHKSGFAAYLALELKRRRPRCSRFAERRAKMEKRRRNESREALSVLYRGVLGSLPGAFLPQTWPPPRRSILGESVGHRHQRLNCGESQL